MKTVGAYEAKTHFPKLLGRVAKGEKITITKHGVPVATLQSTEIKNTKSVIETIEKIKLFRSKHSLGGSSLKEMIDEGRD